MLIVRRGCADDAGVLARMIGEFNLEEGSPGRLTADGVIELCFGQRSRYVALLAEMDGRIVGYTLIMDFFDTEPCAWCSYMQDLYVVPEMRSHGVGQRLMVSAARLTLDEGRLELAWHVRGRNRRGRTFYARVGGEEQAAVPVTLSGDALKRLAFADD